MMSSETLQSSKLPSGRYRLMIRGILPCESSLIAICSASVSPSSGTSTGAFMLHTRSWSDMQAACTPKGRQDACAPDLQRTRTQHSRPLVLCQVRCRDPLLVWLSLAPDARPCGPCCARLFLLRLPLLVRHLRVWSMLDTVRAFMTIGSLLVRSSAFAFGIVLR